MGQSPSALATWLDRDFFKQGAFLTSDDGESVTFGKGGTLSLVEHFLETEVPVFYLKDFYQNNYLAYVPDSFIKISKGNVETFLAEVSESHNHFSPIANDDDLYKKDFGLLRSAFSKNLQKVVLVSRETYEPFESEKTIQRLLKKSFEFGTGLPYGFWNKQSGVIGSTPELLYDVQNNTLKTFALAGTARKGQETELLNSRKDRHEHDLVIKDIVEKLAPFTRDVRVDETHVHPYKSILHLRTNLQATVNVEIDYTELTNSLSPTAALGGYPKKTSMNFLKGTNYCGKYPKRFFGSCFGLVTPKTKEFVVSIRNVQWEDQHLFIESGGGIVPESNFEKEFEEIHLKRNTIRNHYL